MEYLFAIVVGIGLAASSGFRVFVPLLVVSVAANAGYFQVAENCQWLGTWIAVVAFAVATVIEIAAYYIPWIDNLLDTIATPMAVIAGAILFAASLKDFGPFWQWSLAIIAGGGSAAIVQGGTVASRLASTASTGGLANFVVSTSETLAGFFFSITSIVVPLVALILLFVVVGGMYYVGREVMRNLFITPSNADS
jgi:Domain of unknown function (DUF4126)